MGRKKKVIASNLKGYFEVLEITGVSGRQLGAIVLLVDADMIYRLGAALEDSGFNVRREGNDKLVVHALRERFAGD